MAWPFTPSTTETLLRQIQATQRIHTQQLAAIESRVVGYIPPKLTKAIANLKTSTKDLEAAMKRYESKSNRSA